MVQVSASCRARVSPFSRCRSRGYNASQDHDENGPQAAAIEEVVLDDEEGPAIAGRRALGVGQIGPPHVAAGELHRGALPVFARERPRLDRPESRVEGAIVGRIDRIEPLRDLIGAVLGQVLAQRAGVQLTAADLEPLGQ